MNSIKALWFAGLLLFAPVLQADEGMWLPSLLNQQQIDRIQQMGANLSADDIYNINTSSLKDAVISLNGGSCTGELVSSQGLFLTNHHCGYGQIQQHSTEDMNILRDGFWAADKTDELHNKGMYVSFLISVEDVSEQVLSSVTRDMSEQQRRDSINKVISRLVRTATEQTHYNANVKSFYNDNQYLLLVYETFRDVRLVGAPPHFIGKFGGDTDNWMWPRHTGDFALFRIYSAPDGSPADYSENNIPLVPRHYLPISLKGYGEGDFAMIMGYPGSTNRYLTAQGVKFTMDVVNSTRIVARNPKLEIIRGYMSTSEAATIQYATKHARSSNYYKYSIGQNRGIERLKVAERKHEVENQFAKWVNADAGRVEKYGDALGLIEEAYRHIDDDIAVNFITEAFHAGPEIFQMARHFESFQRSLEKRSKEPVSESNVSRLRERGESFFKDYHPETDQKIVAALTKVYADNVHPNYHPKFIGEINRKFKGDYDAWAAWLFNKSFLADVEKYMAFLDNPKIKTIKNDPILKATIQIYDMLSKARGDNEPQREMLDRGYRILMEGLLDMDSDNDFYPNANSTMRLTYGNISGYEPRDGVFYNYHTTLKGYIEKEIPGDREFDVWPRLKELYYASDFGPYADANGMLYTCFISNNDITGGNSGSPVINADGELIGIAFDGNWEAMSGDIVFETELQKCINVDIRFVMWVIDKFAGATHLIEEMKLVK
jgi:hypothetical protein